MVCTLFIWKSVLLFPVCAQEPAKPLVASILTNLKRSGKNPTLCWAKGEIPITQEGPEIGKGDDSEKEPSLVEAWVCRNGRLTFVSICAYYTEAKVID